MLEFIAANYVIVLVVLIIIVCLIIFLVADGKLFKKKENVEEKKDTINSEANNASSTINTNDVADSVMAATVASAMVNNSDINAPFGDQTPAPAESSPLPEDIFTPIEDVPVLSETVVETPVAESSEVLVEPTVVEEAPVMESVTEENLVTESPVTVEETNETVVPLEQSQEAVPYETNKDILVNVLDTPVNETVVEAPVAEEISFDFMPIEESNVVEETVPSVNETMEAPMIDEEPIVSEQEETPIVEEDTVNQPEEIIDEDPTLLVDESTFFNAHLYDDEPSVEEVSSESSVEETVDPAFNEIETLPDDIIDMPDVTETPSVENVSEEESNSAIATDESTMASVENVSVEETLSVNDSSTVEEPIETLSTETSQEVDTAENASETIEDEEWKF